LHGVAPRYRRPRPHSDRRHRRCQPVPRTRHRREAPARRSLHREGGLALSGSNPKAASPATSPQGLLAPPPKRGPGVRRLNKVPLAIACGAGVIVAAAVGYTYHLRASQQAASAAAEAEREPKPANGQAVLADAPEAGHIDAPRPVSKPTTTVAATNTTPQPGPAVDEQAIVARKKAWTDYYQAVRQRRQQLVQGETQALSADTGVGGA